MLIINPRVADGTVTGGAMAGPCRPFGAAGTDPVHSPLAAIRALKSRILLRSSPVRFTAAASSADIWTVGRYIREAGCAPEKAARSGTVGDDSVVMASAVD